MKALIQKDCYVLWRQMRFLMLVMALMTLVNSSFYTLFAVIWAAMLPYTTVAYDERCHWDQLAAMMPYPTRDLVLSKYVLGWLCMGVSLLLCLIIQAAHSFISHTPIDYMVLVMSFFVGAITLDITLPLVFRFGVERGRMGFMLVIIGGAVLGSVLMDMEVIGDSLPRLPVYMAILFPVVVVVATVFSVPLAMRMYRNRS